MKTYLITYGLTFSGTDPFYDSLINKIKSYQYWAKPFPSVWLIKTTNTKESIMSYLRTDLSTSDKILIIEVTNDWISLNLNKDVVEWMQGGL